MSKAQNDFNTIARIYDQLSKMVYADRLIKAQEHYLGKLPAEGRVLFIGGGSGEILPRIWGRKPRLQIDFIDASSSMINLAEKQLRKYPKAKTIFICGTEADMEPDAQYDAVLTFFFLDLFKAEKKLSVASKLKSHLKPKGIWLHADFLPASDKLSKLREKLMFKFFKSVSRIEADEITDDQRIFDAIGIKCVENRTFGRKVYAAVYESK